MYILVELKCSLLQQNYTFIQTFIGFFVKPCSSYYSSTINMVLMLQAHLNCSFKFFFLKKSSSLVEQLYWAEHFSYNSQ